MHHADTSRRAFLRNVLLTVAAGVVAPFFLMEKTAMSQPTEKLTLSNDAWRERLTPEQYHILREHGTERAFTSPLYTEKRQGMYHCAGCDQALFTSDMKYDSGTGWPSFWDALPATIGTSVDTKLFMKRTEYHCAKCGGHHGHVFEDGPKPTGLRYCNNGDALVFKPA